MGIRLDHKALTSLLDESTRQLPPAIEVGLASARRAALQRQAQQNPLHIRLHQLVPVLSAPLRHHPLGWGALLFAAILIAVFFQWQHFAIHDHSALDLAILIDDLPVRMYVD